MCTAGRLESCYHITQGRYNDDSYISHTCHLHPVCSLEQAAAFSPVTSLQWHLGIRCSWACKWTVVCCAEAGTPMPAATGSSGPGDFASANLQVVSLAELGLLWSSLGPVLLSILWNPRMWLAWGRTSSSVQIHCSKMLLFKVMSSGIAHMLLTMICHLRPRWEQNVAVRRWIY